MGNIIFLISFFAAAILLNFCCAQFSGFPFNYARNNDINGFNNFGQSFLTEWNNNPANARLVARVLERSLANDDRRNQQVLQQQRVKLRENPYYQNYQSASNPQSRVNNLLPEFYQQPQNTYRRSQNNYRQQQNYAPQSSARYVIT